MKLVLYNDAGDILEIIENCGEVSFDIDAKTLKYRGGELWPYTGRYAVLNDDEEVTAEVILEHYKRKRIDELDHLCEQTIMNGFEWNGYWFSFDKHDQDNFTQMYLILVDNPDLQGPIRWKTENAGIIELTREEFKEVCLAAERHKRGLIERYWVLKNQVLTAGTFEEVSSVRWEN